MSVSVDTILRRLGVNTTERPIRPRRVRRHKASRSKRMLRGWTWDGAELSGYMEQKNKDVFLGTSDVSDYIISDLLCARNDRCISTKHEELTVLASLGDWLNYAIGTGLRIVQIRKERGLLIQDETLSHIDYDVNSSSTVIKIFGDQDFVEYYSNIIRDMFEEVTNVIEWIYSGDGQSIEVPLRPDRVPVSEMYPWLKGESLESYYDRFMHSDASILLLIGPPGTGKTTFIRGLLQHSNESAIVTYDANILSKDHVFANFVEGDRSVMVIEDADNFLGARSNGNDLMHKFLNVGDGLVTTKNKKLIFSTNLPSVKDIDSALVRPGRCFDIVTFDLLTADQAASLAKKLNVDFQETNAGKYSIADIFHKQVQASTPKRKLGFI